MSDNPFRRLPAVNDILADPALADLADEHAHAQLVDAVRSELTALRETVAAGGDIDGSGSVPAIAARAAERLGRTVRPTLRPVINATGIALHTNLGRAPIAAVAARAAHDAAAGYLNLELDLETGQRCTRQAAVRDHVCRLTGAESATVVNNNAAATVIVLRTIAKGREVLLSRGQLIEIGGSIRIPEIMAVSGALLREVGTTNITRVKDYEDAINPLTGAILQVHTSNFRIRGFTKTVPLADLVALGRKHNLPVIDDVGSGALLDFSRFGLPGEPLARDSIAAGVHLVLFSGDKLLGGPQAGIIAGRKEWIEEIERDPLMRAFRLDKMTLAALEATLRLYLHEDRALRELPLLRMLGTPLDELRQRAEVLASRLADIPGLSALAVESVAYVGGGSLPDQTLPTWVVQIETGLSDEALSRRLRTGNPAVLGRLQDGKLLLDVRTVFVEQEEALVGAVRVAVEASVEA